MGNWWGAEEDSNNVNTSTSTKGNITSQTLGGTVSSKPKYIYRHSDPRDPITLFSSHKSIEIFTKEEMKQLMSKMEGRINKKILNLYNKYGQFRLENEEIMKENNQRKKRSVKIYLKIKLTAFILGNIIELITKEREEESAFSKMTQCTKATGKKIVWPVQADLLIQTERST